MIFTEGTLFSFWRFPEYLILVLIKKADVQEVLFVIIIKKHIHVYLSFPSLQIL